MAISTYDITLKYGVKDDTLTSEIAIKSFPDLGGATELIDVTNLTDDSQIFIEGIENLDALDIPFPDSFRKYFNRMQTENKNERIGEDDV